VSNKLVGCFAGLIDDLPSALRQSRVLDLGHMHNLTSYDATYLELAMLRTDILATFDRKLAGAAPAAGVLVFGDPRRLANFKGSCLACLTSGPPAARRIPVPLHFMFMRDGKLRQSVQFPSMDSGRWGGILGGLLEEPRRSSAEKRQQRRPAENIDIGLEGGLLLH
jgi:hypothetical protein